ncbi:hypothetical protein Tco_0945124 [Tanacetum coccineum]
MPYQAMWDMAYWGFLRAQIHCIFLDGYDVLNVRTKHMLYPRLDELKRPLPDFEEYVVSTSVIRRDLVKRSSSFGKDSDSGLPVYKGPLSTHQHPPHGKYMPFSQTPRNNVQDGIGNRTLNMAMSQGIPIDSLTASTSNDAAN